MNLNVLLDECYNIQCYNIQYVAELINDTTNILSYVLLQGRKENRKTTVCNM